MDILIVSPDSELSIDSELIAAVDGNNARILRGMVPVQQVIDHISSGKYDAVHFASHGSKNALEMSNGTIDDNQLEQALQTAAAIGKPVRLLLLNACRSVFAGAHIYSSFNESPAVVIAWAHDVPDNQAQFFGIRFWESLTLANTAGDAFHDAEQALLREFGDVLPPLMLNGRVDDLRSVIKEMTKEMQLLKEQIEELKAQPVIPRWVAVVLLVLSGSMIMSLATLFWALAI